MEQFQQLEIQLRGTVAQQQAFFNQISQDIDSGFAEVCQQLGVMETNITRLLQNLERRLDDLDEKLTRLEAQRGRQLSKRELRNRQKLLAEMRTEAESRLSQSLHNAVLLNLGKEQQPHQVERPWDVSVKVGEQRAFQLPSETGILEVFEDQAMGGKFLILGKPGGGKTTTLLELLRDLVDRAEMDPDALIPVKLELSEWQAITKRKFPDFWNQEKYDLSIKDWILSQLRSLGIDQEIGEQWIRDKELILLLDGLDELPSARQADCVRAINRFLESEFCSLHLVVCSRKEEYENYEEKLLLNGAICLEDLTVEQMEGYFSSVNLGGFWESIKDSEKIVSFISQPLFLTITSIAYQQIDIEEWGNCNTEESAIDYLLGIYYVMAIDKSTNSTVGFSKIEQENLLTYSSLIWLAKYLENSNDTELNIMKFQRIPFSKAEIFYKKMDTVIDSIVFLFWLSILFNIFKPLYLSIIESFLWENPTTITRLIEFIFGFGLMVFLNCAIALFLFAIFYVLTTSEDDFSIQLPNLNPLIFCRYFFDFSRGFLYLTKNCFYFFIVLHTFLKLLSLSSSHGQFGVSSILQILLISIASSFIISPLLLNPKWVVSKNRELKREIKDRQINFLLLVLNVLSIGIFWFLYYKTIGISIVAIYQATISVKLSESFFIEFLPFVFSIYLVMAVWATGLFRYFLFRFTLFKYKYMPWNITHFLDYCTERLILQRVGNRYRFIHRLVQEHFANLEIQKE